MAVLVWENHDDTLGVSHAQTNPYLPLGSICQHSHGIPKHLSMGGIDKDPGLIHYNGHTFDKSQVVLTTVNHHCCW